MSFDPKAKECLQKNQRVLFALWHGDILPILSIYKHVKPCIALVSPSAHGDVIEHILLRLGLISVRGSARTLAKAGSKELLRMAKLHHANIALAVDGPSGPRHKVKPGIFILSYLLNYPILSIQVEAPKKYILNKLWDKPYIPLPFSRVSIRFEWVFAELTKERCRNVSLPEELKGKMPCEEKRL